MMLPNETIPKTGQYGSSQFNPSRGRKLPNNPIPKIGHFPSPLSDPSLGCPGRNEPSPTFGQSLTLPANLPVDLWAILFWVPLAFAIVRFGAVEKLDWCLCLAAIGIVSLVYHARTPRHQTAPLPGRCLRWGLIALPVYVLCQTVPVPVSLLPWLAPDKAEMAAALGRIGTPQTWMALSVGPSETVFQLFRICGCVLFFLAARHLTCRGPERAWRLAAPLIVVGTAEAVLGLYQTFTAPGGFAHGTYVHRNHFAGLLEMALPFAVVLSFRTMTPRSPKPLLRNGLTGLALASAALILGAIACSLSRSGFAAAVGSLCLMAFLATRKSRGLGRRILAVAAAGALLTLVALLPPDRLIERFRQTVDAGGSITDVRPEIWSNTTRLIGAYPVFGCGLGAFEMALNPFRTAALEVRMDYAHNDYLQALAELGIVGFAILAVLLGALVREIIQAVRCSTQPALALAAAGALAALAAHSFTDFNLHIPANALVAAWIAGIASGLATPLLTTTNKGLN